MPREIGAEVAPPLYLPWDPDSSIDFHAARILILLLVCGQSPGPNIEGRTKLAKLDFFVRYPSFLERVHRNIIASGLEVSHPFHAQNAEVEAPMIRYRYGPWDNRYRQFIAFLEARKLVTVLKSTRVEKVKLTAQGRRTAEKLRDTSAFQPITERCTSMVSNLGAMNGTDLKELIYNSFPDEVAQLSLWREIQL